MTAIDYDALLAEPPEEPDLEGLADEAVPAVDPGPEGELTAGAEEPGLDEEDE